MKETALRIAVGIALKLLEGWIDSQVAGLPVGPVLREAIRDAERKLAELLEGPVGRKLAGILAGYASARVLKRAFPNDSSTGDWS